VQVEIAREELRHSIQRLVERRSVEIGADEDERPQLLDESRPKREVGPLERLLALGARRGAKRSVEVVRPGLVGTLQRLAAPPAQRDLRASVPADVHERLQLSVPASDDDERNVTGRAGCVLAGLGDPPRRARIGPRPPEDALLLSVRQLLGGLPAPGQGVALLEVSCTRHGTILPTAAVRNQSLAEATLDPGQATQRHYHREAEEMYFLLEGIGEMEVDGEGARVSPGDAILIPPGAWHQIRASADGPLRLLCCCAPPYRHEDTYFRRGQR